MTNTVDSQEPRRIAEQVVRHIAAGTGFTTIVTIGLGADGLPVITHTGFSPTSLDASYRRLLETATSLQRRHPRGAPAYACALVLPERDVAYLHHQQTGTGLAQVLTVGREPVNDPDTHAEVSHGLAELMRALEATQPPPRPTGRAFLAQPGSQLVLLADPPPGRPRGYQGRHR
jgi:hypothetical protein